jgi:hypothetical protein
MLVEAEIGSERGLGLSVLQGAFSSRVCDSRSFQKRGSWCRGSRRSEHRSEPCAGGNERKLRSLKVFFGSPISNNMTEMVQKSPQAPTQHHQTTRGEICGYLPCLRLLIPSTGSDGGVLSLTEDMAGVPLTSLVQIGHNSALFESPEVTSRHYERFRERIAEDNATINNQRDEKVGKSRECGIGPGGDSRGCGEGPIM